MAVFRNILAVGLFGLALFIASVARAEPEIIPFYGQGAASDAEVRRHAGGLSFTMIACDRNQSVWDYQDSRHVSVTLARRPENFEQRAALVDAVLARAARFAWRECPHLDYFLETPTGDFFYNIDDVEIRGPDGQLLISAMLGSRGFDPYGDDGSLGSSRRGYKWDRVIDRYAEAQQAEAAARARQARIQAARAEQARQDEANRRALATFWGWVRLLLVGALALWAFLKREALLYWYYSLTPHPASDLVHQAIAAKGGLDGDAFGRAAIVSTDNRVERRVREDQGRRLTELWRDHERALHAEEAELVRREERRAKEENARLEAERSLLRAAIAHEEAAARVEALRKREQTS